LPIQWQGREPLLSGTVTLAFTDVEGSTQRWERIAPRCKTRSAATMP